jgi:hypothetical protein
MCMCAQATYWLTFWVQAKFIGKAEEEYENLLQGLEPTLAAKYRGRCLEAVKEGMWSFYLSLESHSSS